MVYVNIHGTLEGQERARKLNLRAQAKADQAEAKFRTFVETLDEENRSKLREQLFAAEQAKYVLAKLRHSGAALSSVERMLAVIDRSDT